MLLLFRVYGSSEPRFVVCCVVRVFRCFRVLIFLLLSVRACATTQGTAAVTVQRTV